MHKEILETTQDQRSRQRDRYSRNRTFANFGLGDYVLVALPEKRQPVNYL